MLWAELGKLDESAAALLKYVKDSMGYISEESTTRSLVALAWLYIFAPVIFLAISSTGWASQDQLMYSPCAFVTIWN